MNLKLQYFGHLMQRAYSFGGHFDLPVSVGAHLGAGPQGQLLLNNDIKANAFQPCVTLSTQETGKAIYLGGRKGRRENVFSRLSSQLLRGQTTKPAPRASIPKSEPCVTLHFPSLANTFLGQHSTAHREGGFGSVATPQQGAILGSPS